MTAPGRPPVEPTTELDFRILGPVRAYRDGVALPLSGSKRKALLALLVSNSGRVVSVSSIASALWEEAPPSALATSIQVAVSGLRSALGEGNLIDTVAPGYRINIPAHACDLVRFRAARDAAMADHAAGYLDAAASGYRAALSEWSGEPLEDIAELRFAADYAVKLAEERMATQERRIEADLALGRHRDLVSELATLTAEHPLRESLWASYMLALYRNARQADALAAYRTLRDTLRDELGLEPSAALRELESAVLEQDERLNLATNRFEQMPMTISENTGAPPAYLLGADDIRTDVPASGLQIGRMPDNGLVLEDPKVSRYHASVVHTATGYVVTDLHSTNGVRVNAVRITAPQVLRSGDTLGVGETTFEFHLLNE